MQNPDVLQLFCITLFFRHMSRLSSESLRRVVLLLLSHCRSQTGTPSSPAASQSLFGTGPPAGLPPLCFSYVQTHKSCSIWWDDAVSDTEEPVETFDTIVTWPRVIYVWSENSFILYPSDLLHRRTSSQSRCSSGLTLMSSGIPARRWHAVLCPLSSVPGLLSNRKISATFISSDVIPKTKF